MDGYQKCHRCSVVHPHDHFKSKKNGALYANCNGCLEYMARERVKKPRKLPKKKVAPGALVINGTPFSSMAACHRHVRAMLQRIGDGNLAVGVDDVFLRALFLRHPNHDKVGLRDFTGIMVGTNFGGSLETQLVCKGMDNTPISYILCIKSEDHSPLRLLQKAARSAVHPQAKQCKDEAFAKSDTIVCPVDGTDITRDGNSSHVDHHCVKFNDLLLTFIDENELDISTVAYVSEARSTHEFADKKLETAWQRYHQDNAVLRVISKAANLKLG